MRRLQVVIVIDQKVQKDLKVREMAFKEVQKVADSLNVILTVNREGSEFSSGIIFRGLILTVWISARSTRLTSSTMRMWLLLM